MVLAIAALAACSNEEELTSSWQNDPTAMKVNATVGSGIFSRSNPLGDETQQKTFNNGDEISIAAGTQNAVVYKLTDGTWTPEAGYLKWETTSMDITAYYPVTDGTSAQAFTLPTDQADEAKIVDADYMTYSGKQNKPDESGELTIEMERKMARVIVKIEAFNNQYSTDPTVTDVKIISGAASYAADATAGDATAVTPYAQNLNAEAVQVGTTYTALVIPTDKKADEQFITMTVAGTPLTVKGIPAMEAGKSFTYNLTIGKDILTVGEVTVTPWGDGTITGGEATVVHTLDELSSLSETEINEFVNARMNNGKLTLTGSFGDTNELAQANFSTIAKYIREHKDGSNGDAVTALDFSETTGVTTIGGDDTFSRSALVSVNLPASVTTMKGNTFLYCNKLVTVTGGADVITMSNDFYGCSALTAIPTTFQKLELNAFFNCSFLKEYSSTTTEKLGQTAFSGCTSLTKVDCPNVTSLFTEIFSGCSNLSNIYLTAETFTFVRSYTSTNSFTGKTYKYNPFYGITSPSNVTLYLNASQKTKITDGKWNPVEKGNFYSTGLEDPIDISIFKEVYCGTDRVYPA